MAGRPFISVVVPTHNRLALLERTIDCLRTQTLPRDQYEIVVVDDGSGPTTREYLSQQATEGVLHVVHQVCQGSGAARNTGARVACGEILAFTDDDCLPEPDWLAALACCYRSGAQPPPDAVGGWIRSAEQGHWLDPLSHILTLHSDHRDRDPFYLDTANASFRRSLFWEVGGFDTRFPCSGEDLDLGLRWKAAGYRLSTTPDAVVWHVNRSSLLKLLAQSFTRGRGLALLMVEHPALFAGPPSPDWRRFVRRALDRIVERAGRLPVCVRPLLFGLAAALRRVALDLSGMGYYVQSCLPDQVARARALGLGRLPTTLYLGLGWVDHAAKMAGQAVDTFYICRDKARDGTRPGRANDSFAPVQAPRETPARAPLVSVVLPTYNRARALSSAVASVLNQTLVDFELIIVDDASVDGTPGVLERFDDPRIRIVRHSRNRGVAAARNTGIEASAGCYVAFQDSDDEWLPHKLEKQVATLNRAPASVGIVYSAFWHVVGERKRRVPAAAARWAGRLPSRRRRLDGDLSHALKRGNFITPQATMVRRACFREMGAFDEALPPLEDWDLWLRLARRYRFTYLDEPMVVVYRSADSISSCPSAFIRAHELLLERHHMGHKDSDLLASYYYTRGHLACTSGDTTQGRRALWQAVRTSPANTFYWAAALASLCGTDVYRRLLTWIGMC